MYVIVINIVVTLLSHILAQYYAMHMNIIFRIIQVRATLLLGKSKKNYYCILLFQLHTTNFSLSRYRFLNLKNIQQNREKGEFRRVS